MSEKHGLSRKVTVCRRCEGQDPLCDQCGGEGILEVYSKDSLSSAKAHGYDEVPTLIQPDYYHKGNLDVFAYLQANFPKDTTRGFFIGNILKYLTRYPEKNGYEDLQKAYTYFQALLKLEK